MKAAYDLVLVEHNLQPEAADVDTIPSMNAKDSCSPSQPFPLLAVLVYCPELSKGFISAFMLAQL